MTPPRSVVILPLFMERTRQLSRRDLLKLVGVGAAGLALSGCDDRRERYLASQKQILEREGILGEHPLVDLREIPGFQASGSVGGGLFFFGGNLEGKNITSVQFAWRTNEQKQRIIITTLPMEKVAFMVVPNDGDASEKSAKVQFELDFTNISAKMYPAQPVDSKNPNDFLDPKGVAVFLGLATIEMDEKTFRDWRSIK